MSEPWIALLRLPADVGTRMQALSARTQISTTVLICRAVVAALDVIEEETATFDVVTETETKTPATPAA